MLKTILLATAMSLSVYDGDTMTVNGVHYRMVGWDSPEIHGKCAEEKALAIQARNELMRLVKEPSAQLVETKCVGSNFGRSCGRLIVDGSDVAPHMVSSGLGHAYKCIGTRCPRRLLWCSK